jgi:glycosyltransferase involved in cell wall biosynthesis
MPISILMPVYNAAPYLEACLDSILAQTYPDWELLAVDDHSTDESAAILRAYSERDGRIQVLSNEGKGIIPALRLAYATSRYELITRMDADDLMPARKLEKLRTKLLDMGPCSLSTGLVEYFSEGELQDGYRRYAAWLNQIAMDGRQYAQIYRECVIPSPCWLLRRQDLERCGAFDPDRYPEDYDLVFRFYEQKLRIGAVPEVLHRWRDHPARSSRTMAVYARQEYFELKLSYFLALDHKPESNLVLWGAGRKGKRLAKMLKERNCAFQWVCDTPNKWGHRIYDQILAAPESIFELEQVQILIVVSAPDDQLEVRNALLAQGKQEGVDFWFWV